MITTEVTGPVNGLPQHSELEAGIRAFVVRNFLFGDASAPLRSSDSLLEQGIVDSTGILELVGFLEETYKVRVEDDELTPDNLDSIASATAFVRRKLASPGA